MRHFWYQVSAAGDSITHVVEASLGPNEVGVTYRRAIRLARDRLVPGWARSG